MKRLFIVTAMLSLCFSMTAQVPQDSLKLAGSDYVYSPYLHRLTAVPKGYELLAVEHYGRHGARYAWQSFIYTDIKAALDRADSLGVLTDAGRKYREDFMSIYGDLRYHEGELSDMGWRQQYNIARVMYKSFPEAFKGAQKVSAVSSSAPRCMMSMTAFCLGLSDCNADLDIVEKMGRTWHHAVIPNNGENPFREEHEVLTMPYGITQAELRDSLIAPETILGRLFSSPETVIPAEEYQTFVNKLSIFANGMQSIDTDLNFARLFAPEELVALWKIDNYGFGSYAWSNRYQFVPILEDIIEKGDGHIASGTHGADLRFGHDSNLFPLVMLLGINGQGLLPDDFADFHNHVRNYDIPMGANIQIAIYRSKRGGEPLFKLLLNGEEASLPFEPVCGPYYKWSDLKALCSSFRGR